MENRMVVPPKKVTNKQHQKNLNIELLLDPAIPLVYTQNNWKQGLKEIFVHSFSEQHYSQ